MVVNIGRSYLGKNIGESAENILGPKGEEITNYWKILHNYQLHE